MNRPLVSILTTVFNREKYIAACIESVLNSSYHNWEMIIVDDQSKDKSVEIAKRYAAKEDRIKVYVNEKNLGDYANRNQAQSKFLIMSLNQLRSTMPPEIRLKMNKNIFQLHPSLKTLLRLYR